MYYRVEHLVDGEWEPWVEDDDYALCLMAKNAAEREHPDTRFRLRQIKQGEN